MSWLSRFNSTDNSALSEAEIKSLIAKADEEMSNKSTGAKKSEYLLNGKVLSLYKEQMWWKWCYDLTTVTDILQDLDVVGVGNFKVAIRLEESEYFADFYLVDEYGAAFKESLKIDANTEVFLNQLLLIIPEMQATLRERFKILSQTLGVIPKNSEKLAEENRNLQQQLADTNTNYKKLTEENRKFKQQLTDTNTNYKKLAEESQSLKQQLTNTDANNRTLKEENKKLLDARGIIYEQIAQVREDLDEANAQIKELIATNSELVQEKERTLDTLQRFARESQEQLDTRNRLLNEAKEQRELLLREAAEAVREVEGRVLQARDNATKLSLEKQAATEEIRDWKYKFDVIEQNNQQLKAQMESARRAIQDFEVVRKALQKQIESDQRKIEQFMAEKRQAEAIQPAVAQDEFEKLRAQFTQMTDSHRDALKHLNQQSEAYTLLQQKSSEAIQALQEEIVRLRVDGEEMSRQLELTSQDKDNALNERALALRDGAELTRKKDSLQREVDEWKVLMNQQVQTGHTYRHEMHRLQEVIVQQQELLDKAQRELTDASHARDIEPATLLVEDVEQIVRPEPDDVEEIEEKIDGNENADYEIDAASITQNVKETPLKSSEITVAENVIVTLRNEELLASDVSSQANVMTIESSDEEAANDASLKVTATTIPEGGLTDWADLANLISSHGSQWRTTYPWLRDYATQMLELQAKFAESSPPVPEARYHWFNTTLVSGRPVIDVINDVVFTPLSESDDGNTEDISPSIKAALLLVGQGQTELARLLETDFRFFLYSPELGSCIDANDPWIESMGSKPSTHLKAPDGFDSAKQKIVVSVNAKGFYIEVETPPGEIKNMILKPARISPLRISRT